MAERKKFPKIYHLPWSRGITRDDKVVSSLYAFERLKDVVVMEKLDGENTTLYHDYMHSRSMEYSHHESRNWLKAKHAEVCYNIPEGFRVCGENMYATHTIHYRKLSTYFYVFAIFEDNTCLGWDDTVMFCKLMELEPFPILYRGPWDEQEIKRCWTGKSVFDGEQEGYVVRTTSNIHISSWGNTIAKFVREGHVQTDSHWFHKKVIPNGTIDPQR
jgi:hypothetical protein